MINLVVMGECMLELSKIEGDLYRKSYAGDVFNTAVYLKRLLGEEIDISILSAIGSSAHCLEMQEGFIAHGIETELLQKLENKTIGSYIIDVDSDGERHFSYWRGQSAAKDMFCNVSEQQIEKIVQDTDIFYFSGISLAILNPQSREVFWRLISLLKSAGKQLVFDTNFRPSLWNSFSTAKAEFNRALKMCDLVFAGVEDFELLEHDQASQGLKENLSKFDISELVIKDGAKEVVTVSAEGEVVVPVQSIQNVVDTTSAGDSFNAGYLRGRICGQSIAESVEIASKVAGFVIQHKGAIVGPNEFDRFIKLSNEL